MHQSDSSAQRNAEHLIREEVATRVEIELKARSVEFASGAVVNVDGVADDESVFVEIFAHHGPLKGGQRHKIATDALKLITIGRSRPAAKLIIAFADDEAAAYAAKGTWLSEALITWNIDVLVVDIDPAVRDGIRAAQVRQVMINPSAPATTD